MALVVIIFLIIAVMVGAIAIIVLQYRTSVQEAKNYERGLKMVSMRIHIPPASDDLDAGSRDERDVTEEVLSRAQVMYDIISSTATSGFKTRLYGQKHISFEIISNNGLVSYNVVVPTTMISVIEQAVAAAYPSARLEKIKDVNIFSQAGKNGGTAGGEFTLRKDFAYPIATYQDSKRDASRAMLNALSSATTGDGVAIQILVRPANSTWTKSALSVGDGIKKHKKQSNFFLPNIDFGQFVAALWKPPEFSGEKKSGEDKPLSSVEQEAVQRIEDKTKYPGYETMIRVVASASTANRAQSLLKDVVATFSLFDAPSSNGFKFHPTRNIDDLITAYIMRFFPQSANEMILNSVEMSTLFHLPDQSSIPTSKIKRQMAKQVDGPTQDMNEGFLLGYNEFRGVRKPIRLSTDDRRRHTYIIGQTGTGKSGLLENLAFQDMLDGKGFAFIDPHGDSVERLMGMVPRERIEDVIYFCPSDMDNPIGLNLFEFENDEQRDFLIQETIGMLYKLYDPGHTGIIGPRYEHWFRNAALTIMSDPAGASFIDVPQVFNDQAFTDYKLQYVTDQTVKDFWYKEMAQTSEANKSEVLGWFVSKFGAFLSNEMMRNIIGQTKSGFNIREVMDHQKILFVNLSKGRTGELNSQLLGLMFVMKFQAAAMSRADMPEDQRQDFSLYVDEFQNFATDSFESIMSEARKYRLNLILANQFMTQLTDKIRESIIGNIGTVISGRIGPTDAEILQKKFQPTFNSDDLIKLPNYQTITSVMIGGVPSAAFSMSLIPPMGHSSTEVRDALKKLSAAKYGRSRAEVSREIFDRLAAGDRFKKANMEKKRQDQLARMRQSYSSFPEGGNNIATHRSASSQKKSFLDDWLAQRNKITQKPVTAAVNQPAASPSLEPVVHFKHDVASVPPDSKVVPSTPHRQSNDMDVRHGKSDDEVSIRLR